MPPVSSPKFIIDCAEVFIQMLSSFHAQSQTYSTYISHSTAKVLVSIAPNEFVAFVSRLYRGQISVMAVTQDCGLIDLLEPGDVDKGVDIQHVLAPKKEIPTFYGRKRAANIVGGSRHMIHCLYTCTYSYRESNG